MPKGFLKRLDIKVCSRGQLQRHPVLEQAKCLASPEGPDEAESMRVWHLAHGLFTYSNTLRRTYWWLLGGTVLSHTLIEVFQDLQRGSLSQKCDECHRHCIFYLLAYVVSLSLFVNELLTWHSYLAPYHATTNPARR